MKQAIYTSNNAWDAIYLPNGTWVEVDPSFMKYFISAEKDKDDFSNWNGENRWDDRATSIEGAVKEDLKFEGKELAYYQDGKLIIENEIKWKNRVEFYKFKSLPLIKEIEEVISNNEEITDAIREFSNTECTFLEMENAFSSVIGIDPLDKISEDDCLDAGSISFDIPEEYLNDNASNVPYAINVVYDVLEKKGLESSIKIKEIELI